MPRLLQTFLPMLLLAITSQALSQTLTLNLYQPPDGVITVNEHGDFVDPYFANRALTLADESGMTVRAIAEHWIPWLIAHQSADGRFQRYCKSGGSDWSACKPADADDAGLAVWLELLYRLSPKTGLPAAWRESADKAKKYLDGLRDPSSGLYFVSHDLRVSLLMDNVEIYHLFRVMAAANRRFGQIKTSRAYEIKADQLADLIVRRLWSRKKHKFLTSTQAPAAPKFYPDDVAQVYPWLFKMPPPADNAKSSFQNWLNSHGDTWLNRRDDQFPWGMIALAGHRLNETACVEQWTANSASLRHSAYWTVLDEVVLQILQDEH